MDLIFGDTAAHEEKLRIVQIEAELRGTRSQTHNGRDIDTLAKPFVYEEEHAS